MKRWVARERGAIEALVRDAGGDDDAVADGRVFVGRERAAAETMVEAGIEIAIHAKPEDAAAIVVLRKARDYVAVVKPAGIPTIPDHGGRAHSLLAATARATSLRIEDLHPTSRLDRDVSGIVLFALNAGTSEALTLARAEGRYARRYAAIASAIPDPRDGRWDAPIGRARSPRLREANGRDAKPSATRYRTVATCGTYALLSCEPETGRTHQIRIHASGAHAALLGDGDYGGPTRITLPGGRSQTLKRIYLHCERVAVEVRGQRLELECPPPPDFTALWSALSGVGRQ